MSARPDVRVLAVVADDRTEHVEVTNGAGEVESLPAGPKRLEVTVELAVLNPSEDVFRALRRLVGLDVDLIPRPPAHPAL